MSVDPVLELHGVRKAFGSNVVYDGLELAVEKGETFTVLGPSGTGKSVLLKLLIGLLRPNAGTIRVCKWDVLALGESELRELRRTVGMLFQGAALFDSMSVGENVAYGLREHYRWSERKIRERVAECLDWVGLPGIERMFPADLSGGMKKRVGLARALAPGPEVILYDEPTTGLDPANTRRINELIVSMRKRLGVTQVVITHDIASALAVSDRVGLVCRHRIAPVVTVAEARDRPPPELESFMRGEELEGAA